MLDLAITGGSVVDGTGGPRRRADVGVRDGRVVTVGSLDEPSTQTVDATDLIVAPGFIDIHTHYDAQVWWDPGLTPSSLHGVTSVVAGNCGFTLAPMLPEHADYITRMLAVVEGMPLETLEAVVPYDWGSFAEFLDKVDERRPAVNMGFMVGHSTLRRLVMGEDAVGNPASAAQIDAMCRLLDEAIAAGGLGFSSSTGILHFDGDGNPVPSRAAQDAELIALAEVAGKHPGTSLEMIPTKSGSPAQVTPEAFALMTTMSAVARRSLNWNVLQVNAEHPESTAKLIEASVAAAAQGGRVVPLTACDVLHLYTSFKSGSGLVFSRIPGWVETMTLPPDEKLKAFRDPQVREHLTRTGEHLEDWAAITVIKTNAADKARLEGRSAGDIARDRNCQPLDVVLDLAAADELETVFLLPPAKGMGEEESAWKLRGEVWGDPNVMVGASDAGAHLDSLTTFTFGTSVLGAARRHGLMPLEAAVSLVTDRPAQFYGIRDRGRVAEGCYADLVLFEENEIAPGPIHWRNDLPGGAGRLFSDPCGIHRVIVRGEEIVHDGELTGAMPGVTLRSGRDTDTVGVG